ncbi:MAG: NADPH-dependent FMN reductase [Thiobacillus sp.]
MPRSPPVIPSYGSFVLILRRRNFFPASPEYAHGVTGSMKNALDWMVGCEAFVNKPVALLNASPRAVHAQASLKEIVAVMSALIVEESSITVPVLDSGLDEAGIIAHPDISQRIVESLRSLDAAVCQFRKNGVTMTMPPNSVHARPRVRESMTSGKYEGMGKG